MNNTQIKVQKFFPDVKLPEKKTPGAAAMDISAYCPKANIIIEVGQTVLIPTGFCLEIPEGYFVEIRPRSGLSSKENILIPNSPGTVDSDYRGQVFVPLLNLSKAPFTVTNGLRIAQMLVCRSIEMEWDLVEEISLDTTRGIGGFGSTGKV